MTDPDKPLTVGELIEGLRLELTFDKWKWGYAENTLKVKLTFNGEVIASEEVTIEPAGYEREKDDY